VQLSLCTPYRHTRVVYVDPQLHQFLTWAMDVIGSLHIRAALATEKKPGARSVGGRVGPRADLDLAGMKSFFVWDIP